MNSIKIEVIFCLHIRPDEIQSKKFGHFFPDKSSEIICIIFAQLWSRNSKLLKHVSELANDDCLKTELNLNFGNAIMRNWDTLRLGFKFCSTWWRSNFNLQFNLKSNYRNFLVLKEQESLELEKIFNYAGRNYQRSLNENLWFFTNVCFIFNRNLWTDFQNWALFQY